jgi:hypothetical protein
MLPFVGNAGGCVFFSLFETVRRLFSCSMARLQAALYPEHTFKSEGRIGTKCP